MMMICLFMVNSENLLQKFQDKLASCLLAIFCPVEGHPNVPKRFWDHLSYCLHLLLLNGAYPLLNHKMQVINYSYLVHAESTSCCFFLTLRACCCLGLYRSACYALSGCKSRLDLAVI